MKRWDVTPVTDGHTDTRTCESRAVFCWGRIRNIGEIIWLGMGNQLTWKAKSTFHKTMWDKSEFSIISEQLFQKNIICQIINIDLIHQEIIYDFKSLLISLLVSNSSGKLSKKLLTCKKWLIVDQYLILKNHRRKECQELYNPSIVREAFPDVNLMTAEQVMMMMIIKNGITDACSTVNWWRYQGCASPPPQKVSLSMYEFMKSNLIQLLQSVPKNVP